jgi:hypothetical protein
MYSRRRKMKAYRFLTKFTWVIKMLRSSRRCLRMTQKSCTAKGKNRQAYEQWVHSIKMSQDYRNRMGRRFRGTSHIRCLSEGCLRRTGSSCVAGKGIGETNLQAVRYILSCRRQKMPMAKLQQQTAMREMLKQAGTQR